MRARIWLLMIGLPACVPLGSASFGDDGDSDTRGHAPSTDSWNSGSSIGSVPIVTAGTASPVFPQAGSAAPRCAVTNQDCSSLDLRSLGLVGCCDGLLCLPNAADERVCQLASTEEQAMEAQCLDDRTSGLVVANTLHTSAGDVQFTSVTGFVQSGPAGCLRDISFTLQGPGTSCTIGILTNGQLDANGRNVIDPIAIFAIVYGCPELQGAPQGISNMTGSIGFDGYSCERSASGGACYVGTFEVHLSGVLSESSNEMQPSVTVDDAVLRLEGRTCSFSQSGACPQTAR